MTSASHLYGYKNPDGSLDYDSYISAQVRANRHKINSQWVRLDTIKRVVDYMTQRIPAPTFGLCHGTRRGAEQSYFMELLPNCTVLGTEISPTANEFAHTVQWDFHEIKDEWIGAADFIYSNSLDHAHNPQLALRRWMQCLNDDGICFVEWWGVVKPRGVPSDPFSATFDGCLNLMREWGNADNYHIVSVMPLEWPKGKGHAKGRQGGVVVLANDKL